MADRTFNAEDRIQELGEDPLTAWHNAQAAGMTNTPPPLELGPSAPELAPNVIGEDPPVAVPAAAAPHHAAPHAAAPPQRKAPELAPIVDTGTIADTQGQERLPDLAPIRPTATPLDKTATFSELFSAHSSIAQRDNSNFDEKMLEHGYAPIIAKLGLDPSENPAAFSDSADSASAGGMAMLGQPSRLATAAHAGRQAPFGGNFLADRALQERLIVDAIKAKRAADPKALPGVPDTVEGLHAYFINQQKQGQAADEAVVARSPGGLTGFAAALGGGVAGSFHDPLNVAALAIPGGEGKTLIQIAARDALINGVLELGQQPIVAHNHHELGESYTVGDAIENVGTAAAGGAAFGTALHVVGKGVKATASALFRTLPETARAKWAARAPEGETAEGFMSSLSNSELTEFAHDAHEGKLTPDEQAASNVLNRSEEVGASSPYQPGPAGDATHENGLAAAIKDLTDRRTPETEGVPSDPSAEGTGAASPAADPARPPAALSTARRPHTDASSRKFFIAGEGEDQAIASFKAKVGGAENNTGNIHAKNPNSSASGPAQFTDPTFRDYYRKVYGTDPGEHPSRELKDDPAVQSRLLDRLTHDNAAALNAHGEPITEGNLYLAHFLGHADAVRVLKADASTPIESLLSEKVLEANKFLRGKSTSEVAAWANEKMGRQVASVSPRGGAGALDAATEDPMVAQLNDEALQLDNQIIGAPPPSFDRELPPMYAKSFNVDDITVDAKRFQFKGGADDLGVTDRLAGVKEWNPIYAGRTIVWEDAEGRAFLADGHQRHGLARRIQAETGKPVSMDALVMREADGVSAEDARTYAALKNIAEGTGTSVDAAKVIRTAGPHVLEHLPPKSALVRDGGALARLSDAAFGAVYNDVVPADFAAVIGHLLPDRPEAHEAMIELLAKLEPATRGQAESIVRQGISAGLHKEEQVDLFGSHEHVTSLMLERAKVLEKVLANLRKSKLVFTTAAKESDTLEAVGSKIAKSASEKEAQANAQALEIVARLAFSHGPVADALNDAAAKLAAGAKLADVADAAARTIRGTDLGTLAREAASNDANRLAPDGAGRGSDVGEESPQLPSQSGDQEQPSLIELEHATERFSDPNGPAAKQQAESLVHDLKAELAELERPGMTEDNSGHLSDQEIADELAHQVIGDAVNNHALKVGRELQLRQLGPNDVHPEYDALHKAIADQAMNPARAGEYDKLLERATKAIEGGHLTLEDLGVPENAGPNTAAMKPSPLFPDPPSPKKSAAYAGPVLSPEEAKARVESWKAEAQRIGKESPPAPGTVILSLFDHSGVWSQPYRDMGYDVIQLDLKHGNDILQDLGHYMAAIDEFTAKGGKVAGVLAQPPCTTFAGSGARWWDPRHNRNWANAVDKMWGTWASKFFSSPVEYNQFLVAAADELIGRAKPDFYAMENPRGRIAKLNGLGKANLEIEPHHFGDPYTKNTFVYGSFNNELPTAHVEPTEGSRAHNLRSTDEKEAGLRSLTPEGFAYAFALANRPGTEAADRAIAASPHVAGEPKATLADAPAAAALSRREQIVAASKALEKVRPGELGTVEPFPKEEPGYHRFRYVAEDGAAVGGNYTLEGNTIEGFNVGDVNNRAELGPAQVRQLFAAVHEQHPEVEYVHAYRKSGARAAAGAGEQEVWFQFTNDGVKYHGAEDPRGISPQDAGNGAPAGESAAGGSGEPIAANAAENAPGAALDNGPKVDPAIAETNRQLAELGATAPLRAPSDVAQLGEIGLPLMDAHDQPEFRLNTEGDTVTAADLLKELNDDAAAIKAIKDCL